MSNPTTLADALADLGIRWRSLRPGSTDDKLTCPKCQGGPKGDGNFSLTIDFDGMGAVWQCWRKNHCGWSDGLRVDDSQPSRPIQAATPVVPPKPSKDADHRPEWLYRFWAERKIGARTVDHFRLYATTHWFRDGGDQDAMVFPYFHQGRLANRKYRTRDKKMSQETRGERTLFNVDALGDAPDEIVWVEGELDVLAMFECGILCAVSLPDGAPAVPEKSDRRYEALRTHEALLGKAKRIVLAGDADQAGKMLRDELARRLGKYRCYTVTWPNGCKDACDVLREHGPEAVTEALAAAEPYPIAGLYQLKPGALAEFRARPPTPTMRAWYGGNDELRFPTEGRLIVVTGIPNHGKTSWMRFVAERTANNHERRWAIFTPEHMPQEEYLAELAEVHLGKQFWPNAGDAMTEAQLAEAERFIADKIILIVADPEREPTTLDWLLDKARAAVLRNGTTDLMIDPWNEIEHTRGEMSETDYIGRCLQRLKAFALQYGCNVWVVAHPMKPSMQRGGDADNVPGLYSISGSAHWANKSDMGLTVHVPKRRDDGPTVTEIHVLKSRFKRWSRKGVVIQLTFDQQTGRYQVPAEDAPADAVWNSDEGYRF